MFELLHSLVIDADRGHATGDAHLDGRHPFLADHFPGYPVLPGSLALELAAQVAGPLAEDVVRVRHGEERYAILAKVREAKFLQPMLLPAHVGFEARIVRSDVARSAVDIRVAIDQQTMVRGELWLAMVEPSDGWEEAVRQRQQRVERWQRAAEIGR